MTKKEKDKIITEMLHNLVEIDLWYSNVLEMMKPHFEQAKGKPIRTDILLDYLNLLKQFKIEKRAFQVIFTIAKIKQIDLIEEDQRPTYTEMLRYFKRSPLFPEELKTEEMLKMIQHAFDTLDDELAAEYHQKAVEMGIRDYLTIGVTVEGYTYIAPNWKSLPDK